MNILMVNPFQLISLNRYMHRAFPVANITPHYLSSLVPPGHRVEVIDQARREIDFEQPADLVFVTTLTVTSAKAYAIAAEFRRRGARVVLGGPHASAVPEEAKRYCDAVAIGSAETTMEQIIRDAEAGELKPFYHNRQPTALPTGVNGRASSAWQTSILASRGCELQCSFCSAQNIFGKFYLQRPLDKVLADIEATETRYVNFLDDNFYGASPAAHEYYDQILEALKRKKINWLAQVRLPILTDEVLSKFRDSGCAGFLIGFESINQLNTGSVGKKVDPEVFLREIERIHAKKLGVVGSFIFGFDEDTPETIDSTVDFCIEARMELSSFSILTPFPGTKVYRDLDAQGRILSRDWSRYNCDEVVYQPRHFTPEQLERHKWRAVKRFYKTSSILKRMQFGMNYGPFRMFLLANLVRKMAAMQMPG